jgi:membrane protein required for colicin V production
MFAALSPDKMGWVDYAICGVILLSAMMGLWRGFIKEAFALCAWVAAIWVGVNYTRDFLVLVHKLISYPSARIATAFAVLFVMTLILASLISFLLNHLIEKTGLTGTDRLVGMLFGVARGAVLIAVMVMVGGVSPLPEDPWWKQSQLIPPFQSLAVWLKGHIPSELAGYINFR